MRCFFTLLGLGLGLFATAQTITTVAGGGPLVSGPINALTAAVQPVALTADRQGDIFFRSEQLRPRVFELPAHGSSLLWIAGNGTPGDTGDGGPPRQASIEGTGAMVADNAGNIYLADPTAHRVREIPAATGQIVAFAGNGRNGFAGDAGPAVNAELETPVALAIDYRGDLFIADSAASCVREVSAGRMTTVAGQCGRTADRFTGNNKPATGVRLPGLRSIGVSSKGDLYILGWYNLYKVARQTGMITSVPDQMTRKEGALASIAVTPDGSLLGLTEGGFLYGLAPATGEVRTIAGGEGRYLSLAPPYGKQPIFDPRLRGTRGVAILPNHCFAVATVHSIERLDPASGTASVLAGSGPANGTPALAASFPWIAGVAVDGHGNLYFQSLSLWERPAGSAKLLRLIGAQAPGVGLWADASGNVLIAAGRSGVNQINAATGVVSDRAATSGPVNFAAYVSQDAAGDLFIAGNSHAVEVQAHTDKIMRIGKGPKGASFVDITAIFADRQGNLFISDYEGNQVSEWHTGSGLLSVVAGTGAAGYTGDGGPATAAELCAPGGLWGDKGGNLFIADSGNHVVREVWARSHIITTIAGTGKNGYTGDGGPALKAELENPGALSGDGHGDLFLVDSGAVRELKLLPHPAATPHVHHAACTAFADY